MHVSKILDWNLGDQIQSQALTSWKKSLNLSVFYQRSVYSIFCELCAKSVLKRTPANLSPSLKTSELIPNITSVNETDPYCTFFLLVFKEPKEKRYPGF